MRDIRYLTDTEGSEARFSYDVVYFEMALSALVRWQETMLRRRRAQLNLREDEGPSQLEIPKSEGGVPLPRPGISSSIKRANRIGKGTWDATKEGINCIVFSVMCLEAFINEFGAYYKSNNYFNKYLDELSIKSKWKTIPDLVSDSDFPTGGIEFQMLDRVVSKRNSLVHSNGVEVKMEAPIIDTAPREESIEIIEMAPLPIQTVISCVERISQMKPEYERCSLFQGQFHSQFEEIDIDIESKSKDILGQ